MLHRVVFIGVCILLTASCGVLRTGPSSETKTGSQSDLGFDPLAAAVDRMVVPEEYPVSADNVPGKNDTTADPWAMIPRGQDSLSALNAPSEVFRVQVFTSRLYVEANREKAIAEEIFDLPISL